MEGFGNVIQRILKIVFELLFANRQTHEQELLRFLSRNSNIKNELNTNITEKKIKREIIPLGIITGRIQFANVSSKIFEDLKEILVMGGEYERIRNEMDASITGLGLNFAAHDKGVDDIKFAVIPSDQMAHVTTKCQTDPIQTFFKLFGKPIHTLLREEGYIKSKAFKEEIDRRFNANLWDCYSLNEHLYDLKIIEKNEFGQIEALLMILQKAYRDYCNINKGITRKDIIITYTLMENAGFITSEEKKYLMINLSEKEMTICANENCRRTFEKERRTQKYCDLCSNSPEYQKLRRKGFQTK